MHAAAQHQSTHVQSIVLPLLHSYSPCHSASPPLPHLSSSSPPVTSSVTMYTLRPVMYTAYSLMQLGWSTCVQKLVRTRGVRTGSVWLLIASRGGCWE